MKNIIDFAAIGISTLALGISFKTYRTNSKSQYAQLENIIRDSISKARHRIEDISLSLNSDPENIILHASFGSAVEDLLNTYDGACAQYLDKKIDTIRFKKNYFDEIKNAVDNDTYKPFYDKRSKYQNLMAVYDKWFKIV